MNEKTTLGDFLPDTAFEDVAPRFMEIAKSLPVAGISHAELARRMYPNAKTVRGPGRVLRIRRHAGGRGIVPDEWRTGPTGQPLAWYNATTALELLKDAKRGR